MRVSAAVVLFAAVAVAASAAGVLGYAPAEIARRAAGSKPNIIMILADGE